MRKNGVVYGFSYTLHAGKLMSGMVSSSDERKNVQGTDERYGVMQETVSPIHLLTLISLFFSVWWSPGGEFGLPSHPLTVWHECGIALNAREVSPSHQHDSRSVPGTVTGCGFGPRLGLPGILPRRGCRKCSGACDLRCPDRLIHLSLTLLHALVGHQAFSLGNL